MKTLMTMLVALFVLLPQTILAEGEEESTFKVQAWDFSDRGLNADKGIPCAEFLSYLLDSKGENYSLLAMTGVQGPPGVVYLLKDNKGHIAVLKCGTAGSHGDGGHD